jgi:signal transduction histidine kinase
VRQRLLATLLVSTVTVLAASAPGVAVAADDLSESQRLVDMAQLDIQAVSLAHSLSDERDDMAAFVAGGRSTASGAGVSETERSRVDRQVQEVTVQATAVDTTDAPALATAVGELVRRLKELAQVRQKALSGPESAQGTIDAYSAVTDALDGVGAAIARSLPARGAAADSTALPVLTRAVSQASAERGLLVSALTAGGGQSALTTAAQTADVRQRAALADFRQTASTGARKQYDETVTGSDADRAESELAKLTDRTWLSASDQALKPSSVASDLSARIDLMRSVESSLVAAEAERLASLRDDDVTALELHIALTALCFLLALGVGVSTARSITRPAAALARFARGYPHDTTEAKVVGNDEFATTARAINALVADTSALRARAAALDAEHTALLGVRDALAAERDSLLGKQDTLTSQLGSLQGTVHSTYVNLSLRTLGLVERQLTLIERLEDLVHDPEELQQLFKLDHLATRMRRNSENLLVLAGAEHPTGQHAKSVPLVDVARAAMSEIENYERVRIQFLPAGRIVGFAADDTSHLVAELLENAAVFSPPQDDVHLSGWLLESGELMLSIEDQGIGIPAARLTELNALLERPDPAAPACDTTGMGMYVIARLAARHGIRVQLRDHKRGGVAAVVVIPAALVAPAADPDGPQSPVEAAAAGEPLRRRLPGPRKPEPEAKREPHREPKREPRREPKPAEPEEHTRPADDSPALTAKGLPQRVPKATGLEGEPAARERERATAPVDAEALRRRLGGFQQGLIEGRRDADAETQEIRAEVTAELSESRPGEPGDSESDSESEGVEEARG